MVILEVCIGVTTIVPNLSTADEDLSSSPHTEEIDHETRREDEVAAEDGVREASSAPEPADQSGRSSGRST